MKRLEQVIVVRPGLTAREDISSWYFPIESGGVILEGIDDEERPFRATIRYGQLVRMMKWLRRWIKERERQVREEERRFRA